MANALGFAIGIYVKNHHDELEAKGTERKWEVASCGLFFICTALDIIATLSLIILGALALYNVVPFSPSVSWSLLGIGSVWGMLALPGFIILGVLRCER